MQRHESFLRDGVGVGTVKKQQFGALCLAAVAGLVQGASATRCQVYVSPTLEQKSQAVCETSAGCDVKWGGQLLLVRQRPESCQQRVGWSGSQPRAQNHSK